MRACAVLGVSDVMFCGLPDQRLDSLPLLDVITPIEKCVGEFRPDLVFTPFKEDANQDHRIAFQATLVATRPMPDTSVATVLCYETASSTEWAPPFAGSVFCARNWNGSAPACARNVPNRGIGSNRFTM